MEYPRFSRKENKSCKLLEKDLEEIPLLRAKGYTLAQLAEKYSVTKQAISWNLKSKEERLEVTRRRKRTEIERIKANIASKEARKRKDKNKWKEWRKYDHQKFLEKNPEYNKIYLLKWKEDKPEYDKIKKREQYKREKLQIKLPPKTITRI